ncbi:MAG: septal ring lytic transglycosylase RlpA family protein [Holophagales bacterium]|nr:septal ring lytic transglycosylase RlpA family protein [Holophagales bacterium]MYF96179.1 septal ring lytic transglycosylase RlpA family protein [Holophagales bacterium]
MRRPRSRPHRTRIPLAPALAAVLATGLLAGCASTRGLESPNRGTTQRGLASWYGAKFHGRPTASGEIYDMNRISAAHKQLPMGTVVLVKNRDNGRKLRVPINDRGPFIKGRIIDLSVAAARQLEMFGQGLANVRIKVVRLPPKKRKLPISYPARGWRDSKPNRDRRSGFTIQAGAFRERSSAVALARRLRQELRLDEVRIQKGDGWYRVQVTRRRQQAAETVLQKLQEAGIEALIVGAG